MAYIWDLPQCKCSYFYQYYLCGCPDRTISKGRGHSIHVPSFKGCPMYYMPLKQKLEYHKYGFRHNLNPPLDNEPRVLPFPCYRHMMEARIYIPAEAIKKAQQELTDPKLNAYSATWRNRKTHALLEQLKEWRDEELRKRAREENKIIRRRWQSEIRKKLGPLDEHRELEPLAKKRKADECNDPVQDPEPLRKSPKTDPEKPPSPPPSPEPNSPPKPPPNQATPQPEPQKDADDPPNQGFPTLAEFATWLLGFNPYPSPPPSPPQPANPNPEPNDTPLSPPLNALSHKPPSHYASLDWLLEEQQVDLTRQDGRSAAAPYLYGSRPLSSEPEDSGGGGYYPRYEAAANTGYDGGAYKLDAEALNQARTANWWRRDPSGWLARSVGGLTQLSLKLPGVHGSFSGEESTFRLSGSLQTSKNWHSYSQE
ncbi:hypothetical protein N656DRAFT_828806 [Canariomyces notabilis]|uniref:Uncharacterized protein n=1 Tax=Canariomyces notabilis TaxID=2074819 RepID=A0AAN6TET3_9PEZI|nr:hypothetical protein N656DRAFT_828806 [Canariomyces arenarius]